MRKLCLASFSFKTGEQTYEGLRLVAIDSAPGNSWETEHQHAIDAIKSWFPTLYTESELLSIVCYDTVDGTNQPKKTPAPEYGVYSAHPFDEVPENYRDDMSRMMVIDMNGKRRNFQLAFYDFEAEKWVFMEDDSSLLEKKYAKWMDILPFADR